MLANGKIIGTWRPRKSGKTLHLDITSFDAVSARRKKLLEAEAEPIATLRGATAVSVAFDTW